MDLSKLIDSYDFPPIEPSMIKDQEQSTYIAFMKKITTEPLVLPIIYSSWMKKVRKLKENPQIIEKLKEAVAKLNEENQKQGKPTFEKIEFSAETMLDKIPVALFIPKASLTNVITKRAQTKSTIRDLIYELFPLYNDDPIQFKLRLGSKVLASGEGLIKDCFVPTEALCQIPETGQITMLRLELMILSRGENRRRHEEKSLIWDTNKAFELLTSKEVMFNLFKKEMSLDLVKERAKLFGVNLDNIPQEEHYQTLKDNLVVDLNLLNFKSLCDLKTFFFRFNLNESNKNLLAFRQNLEVELAQTERWIQNEVPENSFF